MKLKKLEGRVHSSHFKLFAWGYLIKEKTVNQASIYGCKDGGCHPISKRHVRLLKQLIASFSATSQNFPLIVFTSWMERDAAIDHVQRFSTEFDVYCLDNSWKEAANVAWHTSCSLSQLLHTSLTGKLRLWPIFLLGRSLGCAPV